MKEWKLNQIPLLKSKNSTEQHKISHTNTYGMITWKYIAKEKQKDTAYFSSGTVIWKFINKENVGFPTWNCDTIKISQRGRSFITHITNGLGNAGCKVLSLGRIV